MILACADTHLGIKSYSSYDNKGLTTAEYEARKSLEAIYSRSKQDDIDMILYLGDFFHTNQPSTENIGYAISWFHKMDSLNKPFFIIPGNHDAAMYSNSLIFLESLKLNNIILVTKKEGYEYKYIWKGWNLHFIPYSYSETMKHKEEDFQSDVESAIASAAEKTIIISHIQEVTAKIGSESMMISKGVDIIDIDNIHETKNIILLSGHMHKHQIYKKGFMTVCYPGNTFYQDATDCNQLKGYVIINEEGKITFEQTPFIRKFISLFLSKDLDYEKIIESRRIQEKSVVFLSMEQKKDILIEDKIKKLLDIKNCILGTIKWDQTKEEQIQAEFTFTHSDPYKLLEESISMREDLTLSLKQDILQKGFSYLDSVQDNTI